MNAVAEAFAAAGVSLDEDQTASLLWAAQVAADEAVVKRIYAEMCDHRAYMYRWSKLYLGDFEYRAVMRSNQSIHRFRDGDKHQVELFGLSVVHVTEKRHIGFGV